MSAALTLRKALRQLPKAVETHSFLQRCWQVAEAKRPEQDLSIPLFVLRSATYHLHGKAVYAHYRTRILNTDNVLINGVLYIGTIYRGFLGRGRWSLILNVGKLIVEGVVGIGLGTRIEIAEGASCVLSNCSINAESDFIVKHGLEIGDGSTVSWGCRFLDESFHTIEYPGRNPKLHNIKIGEHVWIGSNVTVLPGVIIADGCVVAANSLVAKPFLVPNALIGGHPAKIIREDVRWR